MQRLPRSNVLIRMWLDGLVLAAVFIISAFLAKAHALQMKIFEPLATPDVLVLFYLLVVWFITASVVKLYDEFWTRTLSSKLIAAFKAIVVQGLAAILILFAVKGVALNRFFVIVYVGLLLAAIFVEKTLFRLVLIALKRREKNNRTFLILGISPVSWSFAQTMMAYPHLGYRFQGFLDDKPKAYAEDYYLGKFSRLDAILGAQPIDEAFIASPLHGSHRLKQLISTCEKHVVEVTIIPDFGRFGNPRSSVSMFGNVPIVSATINPLGEMPNRLLKTALDLGLAFILLFSLFIWLWPIIALVIKLDSRGPVLFKQPRQGEWHKVFLCYKFRTMTAGCEQVDAKGRCLQARKDDPRITRVGRLLRRLSLDELPQFLNVLRGEMSVVGPRPHPVPLHQDSQERISHYMARHLVKPGITGWAQIHGFRGETQPLSRMQARINHDLWYIENWSLWLDLEIIFATIIKLIKGDSNAY